MYVIRNKITKELIGKQKDTTINIAKIFSNISQCSLLMSLMNLDENEYEILELKTTNE